MHRLATLGFAIAALLFMSTAAKADTFQYLNLDPLGFVEFTITAPTPPPSGDVTSFVSTFNSKGTVDEFQWNSAPGGSCFGFSFPGEACAGYNLIGTVGPIVGAFPAGSFLSPGTYTLPGVTYSLAITDLGSTMPAPEPQSVVLLFVGLLGLIVMPLGRRCLSRRAVLRNGF